MANRYSSTFFSDRSVEYQIEIYDDAYTGAVTQFRTGAGGFELRYDGNPNNRHDNIIPSRLSFDMVIANAGMETFITDLMSVEGRFSVRVKRNGDLYWCGTILTDISLIEDAYYPYYFRVSAVDGLSRLKNIEYKTTGGDAYGAVSCIQHILNALGKDALHPRYYGFTDVFLRSSVDWWHADHGTPATNKDPLKLTRFYGELFRIQNPQTDVKFLSCWDVLEYITTAWGARLYYSGGCYRIEQTAYRLNNNIRESRYGTTSDTALSSAVVNYDRSLPKNLTGATLAGGSFEFLPALRKTTVIYAHKTQNNVFKQFSNDTWNQNASNPKTIAGLGYDGNSYVKVTGTVRLNLAGSSVTGPYYFPVLLRLSVGSNYLKRDITVNGNSIVYNQTQWTTNNNDTVWLTGGTIFNPNFNGSFQFSVTSPNIPSGGDLILNFTALGAKYMNGSPVTLNSSNWSIENLSVELYNTIDAGDLSTDRIYSLTDPGTNSEAVTVETKLGATIRPWTRGRLQTQIAGVWYDSGDLWDVGAAGTKEIGRVLCDEIMKAQALPIRKKRAQIMGDDFYFHNLISDLTLYKWLFMRGAYTAQYDTWEGEWFGYNYTPSGGGGTVVVTNVNSYDPQPPGLSVPNQAGKPTKDDPTFTVFNILANGQTSAQVSAGTVTSIPVVGSLAANAFVAGEIIKILDPDNGTTSTFTVATNTAAGATSIQVTGTGTATFPPYSYIIKDGAAPYQNGGVSAAVSPVTTVTLTSGGTVAIPAGKILMLVVLIGGTTGTCNIGTSAGGNQYGEDVDFNTAGYSYQSPRYFGSAATLHFSGFAGSITVKLLMF